MDNTSTVLSRLFPGKIVTYNGVAIEMKPLPFHKVPDLLDAIQALWPVFSGAGAGLQGLFEHICAILDPCITVIDAPELKVKDLPIDAMPDLLEVFTEQSIDVGKWIGLAGKLNLGVGEADDDKTSEANSLTQP